MNKIYGCIDLKSFFASAECVERGLDPFKANLVVADPERSNATICLAVSPAMKKLGVRNRCRLFEIPERIKYIVAKPRMKLYMEKSAEIYSVYLRFIAPEDIHVYSVDECFFDFTDYLKLYGKTPSELAKMLTDEVYKQTGIRAASGIGTNLFLAKVALDITAKHSSDFTGYLDEKLFKETIWHHRPITDVWNVGAGIANRLLKYGMTDLYGVAHCTEDLLYKEFGVNAELLIDHAWGREPCTIADIKAYKSKSASVSNSQILFCDYTLEEAYVVLKEMVYGQVLEITEKDLVTDSISLYLGYANKTTRSTGGTVKIPERTSSYKKIMERFTDYYKKVALKTQKIRKITVGLNNLLPNSYTVYDLFSTPEKDEKENKMQRAVVDIKNKFGKNAILKGTSYEPKATQRERNKMIGGHNSGE